MTRRTSPDRAVTPNRPATSHSTLGRLIAPRLQPSSTASPVPASFDPAGDPDDRDEVHEPADIALGDRPDAAHGLAARRRPVMEELEVRGDLAELGVAHLVGIERGHRPGP